MTGLFGKRVFRAFASGSLLVFAPAALACGPAHLTPATVARTAPEGDILLQDGKTLRLAGLQPMAAAG
ncbi:MAG: hypothetical protein ACRC7C_13505, partial [Beijerinckiaceae bacterium]